MGDGLALPYSFQNRRFLILPAFRNQNRYGFADYFLGCVTEYAFGCLVPSPDNPIQVFADDGVVGRLDNRGQTPVCLDLTQQ